MPRNKETIVRSIEIIMSNKLGFHLRVMADFVKSVREFRSDIRVRKGKVIVNGKSILGLCMLAASWKSKLQIEAVGSDAVQAIDAIRSFFVHQDHVINHRLPQITAYEKPRQSTLLK